LELSGKTNDNIALTFKAEEHLNLARA